jgi:hypothetical protein
LTVDSFGVVAVLGAFELLAVRRTKKADEAVDEIEMGICFISLGPAERAHCTDCPARAGGARDTRPAKFESYAVYLFSRTIHAASNAQLNGAGAAVCGLCLWPPHRSGPYNRPRADSDRPGVITARPRAPHTVLTRVQGLRAAT